MKYWDFTDETKEVAGHTLRRIVCVEDYPNRHAKKGDVGGWVENADNLTELAYGFHMDDVWQGENLAPVIREFEGILKDGNFRITIF